MFLNKTKHTNSNSCDFSHIRDLVHRVKCNDSNTKEVHLSLSELFSDIDTKELSLEQQFSLQYEIGKLSFALRINTVIEAIEVDPALIHVLSASSAKFIFQAIGSIPSLKYLRVFCHKKQDLAVSQLTNAMQLALNLTSLEVNNVKLSGTEDDFLQLCDALMVLSCTTLSTLKFLQLRWSNKYFGLDDFIMKSIGKRLSCSTLDDVQIVGSNEYQGMSSKTVDAVCQIPMLTKLALINLNLGKRKLAGLKQTLSSPSCKLQYLNLSCNNVGDEGCIMIMNALLDSSSVQELILGNNNITEASAASISTTLIASSSSLKILNLGNNNLGDDGMSNLGKALLVNTSLEKLFLGNCQVGDTGMQYIAHALRVNTTLFELSIKHNNFTPNGYYMLMKAVEENLSLTEVTLDSLVPHKISTRINFYSKMNQGHLMQSNYMNKDVVAEYLIQVAQGQQRKTEFEGTECNETRCCTKNKLKAIFWRRH